VISEDISYSQEALRKSTHFLALLIPLGFFAVPRSWAIGVMIGLNVLVLLFEVVRLRRMRPWHYLKRVFGAMIRPREEDNNFTGAFYILLSGLAVIVLFDSYVAAFSLLFIVLGDVASAMVGRRWGKHRIRGEKTIEGALSFLLVSLVIVLVLPGIPLVVGVAGAVVATVVEALTVHRDDNLTVPLSAGLVMHLIIKMFPEVL
jgi:dolichol kinase